ncbi:MAG: HDOD domain-containing protein [Burkholderiaceae bacterium]|nr:HDOD domain-containing protein [Burkholderiaceae bacterium]
MPDADRTSPATEASPARQLDELLRAVRAHGGLPTVGHTLARLAQLLESDSDAVHELADVILADVALTQRLLRIANTIPYRMNSQAVTTVTRAIMVLGFDQVRSTAMSLVLVDGVLGDRLPALRDDFHQSLLAGSLARELLAGSEAEEAAIVAMFRGIGRLLVAVFAPAAHARIRVLAREERVGESVAARRVLGRSHDEIAETLLRDWSVPDRILSAVQPLPLRIEAPSSSAERVRTAAQFAEAIAAALAPQPFVKLDDVLERFRPAMSLDGEQLMPLLERASVRTREFEATFGIAAGDCPVARLRNALPPDAELNAAPEVSSAKRDAVGRPSNACALLAAGLAEATECLTRGAKVDVNSVVQVALEAMFTGLGYARTALALRDPATGLYRTRAAFGEPKPQFGFGSQSAPNLFTAALSQHKDLHIADSAADKVRASLPDWFARDFAMARSFLLMPLVVGDRLVGFFYADRPLVDPAGLSAQELNLLRALRSQVVLALRSR